MKKISTLLLPAVFLIAACQSQPPQANMPDCVTQDHFVITPSKAKIRVAPSHICVEQDTTIEITVAGTHNKGSVATSPKLRSDTWLSGSNSVDSRKFYLYVNKDVSPGPHDYTITTQGGVVLDPRVTVIK